MVNTDIGKWDGRADDDDMDACEGEVYTVHGRTPRIALSYRPHAPNAGKVHGRKRAQAKHAYNKTIIKATIAYNNNAAREHKES